MISKTVHKVSTKPPQGGFFMYYINVERYVVLLPETLSDGNWFCPSAVPNGVGVQV